MSRRGAGFIIQNDVAAVGAFRSQIVESVYFPSEGVGRRFAPFFDISFESKAIGPLVRDLKAEKTTEMEESRLFIANILKHLSAAKTKSKRYAKYYIPTLVSLINSSDFSMFSENADGALSNFPMIFKSLICDRFLDQHCADIAGAEVVHYALLAKLYRDAVDRNDDERQFIADYAVAYLNRRKKIRDAIGSIPAYILPPEVREAILDRLARYASGHDALRS